MRTNTSRWLLRASAVFVVLLLIGVGLWWYWTPAVPSFTLDRADPEVAAAVRSATDAVRRSPRSAQEWGHLGMTLMANKFEQESVAPFAQAERLDASDPRWPYLRGVALLGRTPDAGIACLRRAVVHCTDEEHVAAAHLRLAEALANDGHDEDAARHFAAVPQGPLALCAEFGLGALAARADDLEVARRHLTRCTDSPHVRQKASTQLAALARRLGQEPTINRHPPDVPWPDPFLAECLEHVAGREGQMRLITALEQRRQLPRALELLRGVARDYPDAHSLLALGVALGRGGQFTESEATLRRCLELEPGLVRAQYYLSLALFAQGEKLGSTGRATESHAKFEDAERWARRATELAPQNGEAHFQLGLTLLSLKRRADALNAFRQALATRPELPDVHLWLGKTLAEDGQRKEAELHLRQAVRYAETNDTRAQRALEALRENDEP